MADLDRRNELSKTVDDELARSRTVTCVGSRTARMFRLFLYSWYLVCTFLDHKSSGAVVSIINRDQRTRNKLGHANLTDLLALGMNPCPVW